MNLDCIELSSSCEVWHELGKSDNSYIQYLHTLCLFNYIPFFRFLWLLGFHVQQINVVEFSNVSFKLRPLLPNGPIVFNVSGSESEEYKETSRELGSFRLTAQQPTLESKVKVSIPHPNRVLSVDHIVLLTSDLPACIKAFKAIFGNN